MPDDIITNMKALKPFLKYLRMFSAVSEVEFQQISKCIHVCIYKKDEIVTRIGEVENYLHFILKGLVRKYNIRNKKEMNTQISHAGHFIHVQESFYSRNSSNYFVRALEPTVLASIHYNDLEDIYAASTKMEHIARLIITHIMMLKDNWRADLLELTPKERFLKFVNRHSDLLLRVQQKHIASYLNIKPETFSRYKHLLQIKKQVSK